MNGTDIIGKYERGRLWNPLMPRTMSMVISGITRFKFGVSEGDARVKSGGKPLLGGFIAGDSQSS
ncbi:hypothetical protein D2E28_15735 [Mycobacteroides abscessus]|nr:hypothetical protein D2E28_15735 [Mycobacteroides abscessus]